MVLYKTAGDNCIVIYVCLIACLQMYPRNKSFNLLQEMEKEAVRFQTLAILRSKLELMMVLRVQLSKRAVQTFGLETQS